MCVRCPSGYALLFFLLCVFLENKAWKSGSRVAGLLRFPPVPPLIGSFHSGFTWVFVVTTKMNRFPSGVVSYLTKYGKCFQTVSNMTETHMNIHFFRPGRSALID